MNVLHVIPAVARRYGGPSAVTVGMCHAARTVGIAATIATTDADGTDRLPVVIGRLTSHEGVPAIFFRRWLGEGFKWSAGMAPWLSAHVAEFDVVHIHAVFSHSSIAAGRACRARGVPYILRPLGTLDPWSVKRKHARKAALLRLGVQTLLSGAAAMHYTTREEQRLAETVLSRLAPGVVVPNGVDDETFDEDAEVVPPYPYVLALSRIDEKKRLDLLIRAFDAVANDTDLPDWRLVIAGDGDTTYVRTLQELARGTRLHDRIVFRGWVAGAEKRDLLRGAQVFAAPSYQENFGIALVESLASGVPAIVTPGVNLGEDLAAAHAGWVVPEDPAGFARALGRVLRDAAGRATRGGHARVFARRFQWPVVARQLATLYEQAATGRRAADRALTVDDVSAVGDSRSVDAC